MDIFRYCDHIGRSQATGKALRSLLLTAIKFGESRMPPMPVRAELAPALSCGGSGVLPELMALARDQEQSDYVRRSALEALSLIAPKDQDFDELLLDLLYASTGGFLWHVVEHTGRRRIHAAEAMLREYSLSDDVILAADAFWALKQLTPSETLNIHSPESGLLLSELESDDHHTQGHAIRSIGRLRLSEATALLERFIADSNRPYRWIVPEALAQIGGARAARILVNSLYDPDVRVVAASLQGLSLLPGPIPAMVEGILSDLVESKVLLPSLGCTLGDISQQARVRIFGPTDVNNCQVFISRHCRTSWNEKGLIQGRKDLPLSPAGAAEAERIAVSLLCLNLDLIISSPARRALQTSQIFADLLHIPHDTHAGLLELDHGEWEGKHIVRLQEEDDSYLAWVSNPTARPIPGSTETADKAVQRLRAAIIEIARFHSKRRILVVSHKHIIALFFSQTLRQDLSAFVQMVVEDVEPRVIPPRIIDHP